MSWNWFAIACVSTHYFRRRHRHLRKKSKIKIKTIVNYGVCNCAWQRIFGLPLKCSEMRNAAQNQGARQQICADFLVCTHTRSRWNEKKKKIIAEMTIIKNVGNHVQSVIFISPSKRAVRVHWLKCQARNNWAFWISWIVSPLSKYSKQVLRARTMHRRHTSNEPVKILRGTNKSTHTHTYSHKARRQFAPEPLSLPFLFAVFTARPFSLLLICLTLTHSSLPSPSPLSPRSLCSSHSVCPSLPCVRALALCETTDRIRRSARRNVHCRAHTRQTRILSKFDKQYH